MDLWQRSKKFLHHFYVKMEEDALIAYAHQLTYSLLLALFPFLIFLFTLIGYAQLDSKVILVGLAASLPEEVYNILAEIVTDVVDKQRGELLSFSIVLALYAASGGFRAFMKGVNRTLALRDHTSLLYQYVFSIIWVLLFSLIILLALLGMVFGQSILQALHHAFPEVSLAFAGALGLLNTGLPVVFIFLMLWLFYTMIPVLHLKPRYALPGAVFSTLVWMTFTYAFKLYITMFANYSRFYGALGSVIALMLWLLLTAMIMLFGAELNAVLLQSRGIKQPFLRKGKGLQANHGARDDLPAARE